MASICAFFSSSVLINFWPGAWNMSKIKKQTWEEKDFSWKKWKNPSQKVLFSGVWMFLTCERGEKFSQKNSRKVSLNLLLSWNLQGDSYLSGNNFSIKSLEHWQNDKKKFWKRVFFWRIRDYLEICKFFTHLASIIFWLGVWISTKMTEIVKWIFIFFQFSKNFSLNLGFSGNLQSLNCFGLDTFWNGCLEQVQNEKNNFGR